MALDKGAFVTCIIFALAPVEVTSWTVDLPEVRKYLFEKNAQENNYEVYTKKYYENNEKLVYYNNIKGNSKHNKKPYEDYEHTSYAGEYGYQSYMEQKVQNIVYKGSVYLEGLHRSIENYTQFLENCTRSTARNASSFGGTTRRPADPAIDSSISNTTSNNTNRLNSMTIGSSAASANMTDACRRATVASERVRRLSALATWATRELQDIAYSKKYKKAPHHELEQVENELILKLAWFLDRLAHYTGYEPEVSRFYRDDESPSPRSTTSTTRPPNSVASAPEDVTRAMMACLNQDGGDVMERCRYPGPVPPTMQMLIDMNNNMSTTTPSQGVPVQPLSRESRPDARTDQSMELLVAIDNRTPHSNLPTFLTAFRRKRSLHKIKPEVLEYPRKYQRRKYTKNVNPAITFLKYYLKHNIWEGYNAKIIENVNNKKKLKKNEVKNSLQRVQRRAIDSKKLKQLLPEKPLKELSNYVKHMHGLNYIKDDNQVEKIRAYLEKIRNDKQISSKNLVGKLNKLFHQKRSTKLNDVVQKQQTSMIKKQKRSIKYEHDVDMPRFSQDPRKDISYYVKNKPGRDYQFNAVQAALVRAGLEQVFNTGNIEVVHRFGANYNPLNPDPFQSGIAKTIADF